MGGDRHLLRRHAQARPHPRPWAPASGLCWYTNYDGIWSKVPRDAFAGAGASQQALLVVPSLNLVVVRNGAYLGTAGANRFWGDLVDYIFEPAVATIEHEAPYPPSPVIRKIVFDPASTILREAPDSDNWPMTWADDGDLYTAYGDGDGFEPLLRNKLSLGLAKVMGMPPTITWEPTFARKPSSEPAAARKAPRPAGC